MHCDVYCLVERLRVHRAAWRKHPPEKPESWRLLENSRMVGLSWRRDGVRGILSPSSILSSLITRIPRWYGSRRKGDGGWVVGGKGTG